MKYSILLALLIFTVSGVKSQDIFYELEKKDESKAKVDVIQPIELHMLVNKHIKINSQSESFGYKHMQIFSSSSRDAREKATKLREECAEAIPEHDAEIIYDQPYWSVRVGKVESHDKAALHRLKHRVKSIYKNAYIVESKDKPNQTNK